MITWTDEDIAAHNAVIEELSDLLVGKMETMPVANLIHYCSGFEEAEGMLINVGQYEDLSEAIWVMLHKLAEMNGEAFTAELSWYYMGGEFIGQSDITAISLLKPFADRGGVVTDLLFNKYLRNVKTFGSDEVRDFQRFLREWTDEKFFDADKLGSKHRPAYDRLMAIDVEALATAEQAETLTLFEAQFTAIPD